MNRPCKRYLAKRLRKIAQWLDPQPPVPWTIRMVRVRPPEMKGLNELTGLPVYWWPLANNVFGFYPAPTKSTVLYVGTEGEYDHI